MKPREYAALLRKQGHTYTSIQVMVSLVYGPVHYKTVLQWLSPHRQASQRRYMLKYMKREDRPKRNEPITDSRKFDTHGPTL